MIFLNLKKIIDIQNNYWFLPLSYYNIYTHIFTAHNFITVYKYLIITYSKDNDNIKNQILFSCNKLINIFIQQIKGIINEGEHIEEAYQILWKNHNKDGYILVFIYRSSFYCE